MSKVYLLARLYTDNARARAREALLPRVINILTTREEQKAHFRGERERERLVAFHIPCQVKNPYPIEAWRVCDALFEHAPLMCIMYIVYTC